MREIAGQDAELPEIRRRARFFALFVMLVFAAVGARLFYLQVFEGDAYYRLTSDSIVRTLILPAVRGGRFAIAKTGCWPGCARRRMYR